MYPIKIFRDPVYNVIDLDTGDPNMNELITALIDTTEFQRLRGIKQLGFTFFAFPGAMHSRFEHSLGVAFLAKRFVEKIISLEGRVEALSETRGRDKRMKAFFDELRRKKALIITAALLHDIGHGPYSHVFESFTGVSHEKWTELIITGDTRVRDALTARGVEPQDICDILDKSNRQFPSSKILASQLDVDRIDYILRDSHMTGVGYGKFDLEWLINVLTVGFNADGAVEIGFDLGKGLCIAEDFVMARIYMYRNVYLHKTNRAAQKMLFLLLSRVRELLKAGESGAGAGVGGSHGLFMDDALREIMMAQPDLEALLPYYTQLTDNDLIYHMKKWTAADDIVVRELSDGLLNRRLFKSASPLDKEDIRAFVERRQGRGAADYFTASVRTNTRNERLIYRQADDPITLFDKNGIAHELSEESKVAGTVLVEESLPEEFYVHPGLYKQFLSEKEN